MARRSGLGRGLDSLIPAGSSPRGGDGLHDLPVGAITPNRFQPREAFDEERLASLAASIAEIGVLQPVLVRPLGEQDGRATYELIAGERRWRAAKRVGLATIPAIVREADDVGSMEQAVVENLHRADLNALEEAAAYQQLLDDFGFTHDALAKRVGKSRTTITNLLRLFQLPPSLQKEVRDGVLPGAHAKALLGTPDRAFQEHLARRIREEGLTVRQVEEAVRIRNGRGPAPTEPALADPAGPAPAGEPGSTRVRPPREREPGLAELEELLGDHLQTRVNVELGSGKGRVVVDFADLDDLERIYRLMTGA